MKRLAKRFVFVAAFVAFVPSLLAQGDYWNETHSGEEVRPEYREVMAIYAGLSAEEKDRFRERSTRDFLGDNALSPVPRILTESESAKVSAGIMQRALALSLFLKDHYSGEKTYLKRKRRSDGQVRALIPKEVVERIAIRAGVAGFDGRIDPSVGSFPNFLYGPDLTKNTHGEWVAYEDNEGFLGGFGDLVKSRETLFRNIPAYKSLLQSSLDPMTFYRDLVSEYRARAGGGEVVLLTLPMTMQSDKEEIRLRKIFSDLGVKTVSLGTKRRLEVKSDGVYLHELDGSLRKVGFIIQSGEHAYFDLSNREALEKMLLETAKEHIELAKIMARRTANGLDAEEREFWEFAKAEEIKPRDLQAFVSHLEEAMKPTATGAVDVDRVELIMKHQSPVYFDLKEEMKSTIPGLTDAVINGKVKSNFSPGLEIIDDKELYLYVEEFIRAYLGEEPIIRNIESGSFAQAENGKLEKGQWQKVGRMREQFVIKGVTGRGGTEVFIGKKLTATAWQEVLAQVAENPTDYKWEVYSQPMVLNGEIADIRRIFQIFGNKVVATEATWGRSSPLAGSGKVNIAADGKVVATFVMPAVEACARERSALYNQAIERYQRSFSTQ